MSKTLHIIRSCGVLFRKLLRSPKTILSIVILCFLFDNMLGNARNLPALYQVRLNGWGLLPCYLSTPLGLSWIAIGFTLLMSDAPFFDELRNFERVRSSRSACTASRVMFIICSAMLFVVTITIMLSLVSGGTFLSPDQWDRALKSMARGVELEGIDIALSAPTMLLAAFSPIQAWFHASIRLVVALSCLGLIQMFLALLIGKKIAILFSSLLVFLDFAVGYMGLGYRMYRASPLSWARLDILLLGEEQLYFPSMAYGLWMGVALMAATCLSLFILSKQPKLFDRTFE